MTKREPAGPNQGVSKRPLTVKEERDVRLKAKLAAVKAKHDRARRNRRLAIVLSSVAAVAVVAVIVTFIVVGTAPSSPASPAGASDLSDVQTWDVPGAQHVDPKTVDYKAEFGMDPPAGGPHWAGWLNCGIYTQPQQNERAVHALEHGAVWVTYDPAKVKGDALATLQKRLPDTYIVLSPYKNLPAPVVASAWGAQLKLTGVNDTGLDKFIEKYWQSPDAPEPGAPCTGGVDGPGRI